jgi:hypothetical protein
MRINRHHYAPTVHGPGSGGTDHLSAPQAERRAPSPRADDPELEDDRDLCRIWIDLGGEG